MIVKHNHSKIHELVLEGLGTLVAYLSTRVISFSTESHTKRSSSESHTRSTKNKDTQQL
jgi:hypothetical protein